MRYWEYKDGVYYSVGKAVTHESFPAQSGKIRLVTTYCCVSSSGYSGEKMVQVDIN